MSASISPAAPFTRILVPLDGSHLAEAVLPATMIIAASCGAVVTLLHVIEHEAPSTVHGERHLVDTAAAEAYLAEAAGRWSGAGVTIECHVHPNEEHDVARSIAEHAAELDANLIALTTHGSGGLRGLLAGSIAQQVLRRGTTPVLVQRPGMPPRGDGFGTILVALDGTPEGDAALPVAVMLAAATRSRLHLTRVVPTAWTERGSGAAVATFSPTASARLRDIEEQEAVGQLSTVVARLPAGIEAASEVRRGDPPDELLRAVAESQAGLLIAATHATTGIEGMLSGSVIQRVIARLGIPTLLIRIGQV